MCVSERVSVFVSVCASVCVCPHERKTNGNMKSMYHVPDVVRVSFLHMRNKSDDAVSLY